MRHAHILSVGYTKPAIKTYKTAQALLLESLSSALRYYQLDVKSIDALISMPSLSDPKFMGAHDVATKLKLFPHPTFFAKTIDVGGASPVSGLLEARRLILDNGHELVAVTAGDAITSIPTEEFLKRADGCIEEGQQSPVIPRAYNRIAEWHIQQGYMEREHLAMVSVLMSHQACRHPDALTKYPYILEQVLHAKSVASSTSLLECARRADGGATILIASSHFLDKHRIPKKMTPIILGGGETSGPLYPPEYLSEDIFTCDKAVQLALNQSGLDYTDIDFYGLYDCFPICFIKALEAVHLCPRHEGGSWIKSQYHRTLPNHATNVTTSTTTSSSHNSSSNKNSSYSNISSTDTSATTPVKMLSPNEFPINTHGGLLCFGAPWETPAMYNIIEAYCQLTQQAQNRQVNNMKHALVYGNGGIFSASSIAILSNQI